MPIDPTATCRVYPTQAYEVSREKIREFFVKSMASSTASQATIMATIWVRVASWNRVMVGASIDP